MKERLALLISGNGTTMRIIIQAIQSGLLSIDVACIIASNPQAGGIQVAKDLNIADEQIAVINPRDFHSKDGSLDQYAFGDALLHFLRLNGATLVGQYGWMPKTPTNVITAYKGKIINQHPGPLDPGRPDFGGKGMYGKRVHSARIFFTRSVNKDYWTEAIAQRVSEDFDKGQLLRSALVDILPTDTPETLADRVLEFEYATQIYTLLDYQMQRTTEIKRKNRLIGQIEIPVLEHAKEQARVMYPRG